MAAATVAAKPPGTQLYTISATKCSFLVVTQNKVYLVRFDRSDEIDCGGDFKIKEVQAANKALG